jgi:hypothetical protein
MPKKATEGLVQLRICSIPSVRGFRLFHPKLRISGAALCEMQRIGVTIAMFKEKKKKSN